MTGTLRNLRLTFGALALIGVAGSPSFAQRQNGTTLAGSKTLDICVVPDETGAPSATWRYSGEISVWNQGAIDTTGFAINDCLQAKTITGGTQFANVNCELVATNGQQIPAGTTQETALTFDYSFDFTGYPVDQYYVKNVANITITNHSKYIGQDYGPSPKVTWDGGEPPLCDEGDTGGCTYTIGYWGAKPDVVWPAPYDRTAIFYLSPYTWNDILPNTNSGSNSSGYYQLARQFIGATLNAANGAAVPAGIQTLLNDSAAFFAVTDPALNCNGTGAASCGTQKTWAAVLASFNEGTYPGGPLHCSDEVVP